jgi:predicted acyl esterase
VFPAKAQKFFFLFLILAFPLAAHAQFEPAAYSRTEAMIPMRDGVRLYTQIDAPANAKEALPILLLRTPYGLGSLTAEQIATALSELSAGGYILVRQDIRGRFKSEGEFVMLHRRKHRHLRHDRLLTHQGPEQ